MPGQQGRIPPSRRGVHRHRLLGAKPVQVMRPARLGTGPAQALTAKGLHADHRTNHVAVDVDVADMGACGQGLGAGVDAGLDTQREAVAKRVNLVDDGFGIFELAAAPAHDLQHGAENFVFDACQAGHFKRCGGDQVGDCTDACICIFGCY